MDTNKYWAQYRYTQGTGSLSDEDRDAMLRRYNRPGTRICIKCDSKFDSEGSHNRICQKCKSREAMSRENDITRNPVMHRDPTLKTRRFAEYTY